jgi:hypothetical protein
VKRVTAAGADPLRAYILNALAGLNTGLQGKDMLSNLSPDAGKARLQQLITAMQFGGASPAY